MAAKVYIGLLIYLIYSISDTGAEWSSPPFLAPDPLDEAVEFFGFNEAASQTNILLEEELDYNVSIAVINYSGSMTPTIGTFEDNKSNLILGAVFEQNADTGLWEVIITNRQDYETAIMQTYRFHIVIGSEQNKIALNIVNIDDNAPVIQANERSCSVEENYEGPMNCTFTISDADGWITQVTFGITSTPTSGSDHFEVIPDYIDGTEYQMNGYLNVTNSLDYETIAMYMLVIKATDGGGNEGSLTIVIEVIDMPDEPPMWTSIISAENILEKSTNTFSVSAIDGDIGINAEINYRIITTEVRDEQYFVVNKTSGVITINPIDRDALAQEIFRFLIVAYEAEDEESAINSTVIIIVEDINDHSPEVSPTELAIEILEETFMKLEFDDSIVITDPDLAEHAQYTVDLTDDSEHDWSSAFLVIPTSGYQRGTFTISVINASRLDYENEDWRNITFRIVATELANTSHVGIRDINVQLINWNDEVPIFKNDTVEVEVPEDVEMGYLIETMLATDRDVDDNVTHSLTYQRTLTIDPVTGDVTTTQDDALDYETMPIVVAQVVATDLASHKTYATLTIHVIDVNDVPPSLYMPSSFPTLEEEVDNGTVVDTFIYATDPDTEAYLVFSIDWDSSSAYKSNIIVDESYYRGHLEIETSYPENHTLYAEATLVVSGRIDYEAFDLMYITIVVTDLTTVHNANSTSSRLTLYISDINDNAPVFQAYDEMMVSENQISDILIGSITATDADGPGNNEVVYYIEPTNGTQSNLVYINTNTGVIRVDEDRAIDAEVYEYLYYNVIASDGVWNTTEMIEIYVIDQNDEEPYLLSHLFESTLYIREKSETGTDIVTVRAFDDDRTSPYNNVSYLINTNYPALLQYFSMQKYTGLLQVSLSEGYILDRDFGDESYTVHLIIRDNYLVDGITWNTNSNTTIVTVILEDINDQVPTLPELNDPAASVSENTANGTHILTVVATDADKPDTNNTRVFYEILSVTAVNDTGIEIGDDCNELFRVETYNQTDALVYANCDLKGYYGTWSLELYVQDLGDDPGPLNDTKTYNIQITDYNYNDPVIVFPSASKSIRLSQTQTLNSQLYLYNHQLLSDFTATDEDNGDSGVVTFSISGNYALEYFTIVSVSENTAQLQLNALPDFSVQYIYEIVITATDGGSPPRSVSQTQRILFISANGPEFTNATWTAWFRENNTGLDDWAIIPEAHYMLNEGADEEDFVNIYYFFTSEDGDMSYFNLDKDTRNLTLKKVLNREEQETLSLYVVPTIDSEGPPEDPRNEAILNITIIVVDVNDNPPVFDSSHYHGGVTTEDVIGKIILTVSATDADLNDTLTYSIVSSSLSHSDSSLSSVSNPFSIDASSGDLLLQFRPLSSMTGYFDFNILVQDEVYHEDTTNVKVYIVSESVRVVFTFGNNITHVSEEKAFIISSFTDTFGFICNIDYIDSYVDSNGLTVDNITTVTTHFINEEDNLPVLSDLIIVASSDVQTITDLKVILLSRSLYLIDVPTGSNTSSTNTQQVIQWVLICLTIFFFVCSIALLVAYIVRTRRLIERLDKLAVIKFGSQDSGLNRIGVVPTTNKFALEGSNPMWNNKAEVPGDNVSHGSGDSDMIGVENNPHFSYGNGGYVPDDPWESERRESFNPVMASVDGLQKPVTMGKTIEEKSDFHNNKIVYTTEL
ncbi:protocadherin-like wing polarity protein stan isoform X2 [Cephus cinctus]|uniref:Protocadherin-like wing polarity protein stan isoform X2 n=1 Tax=Cephus cinctus TaxID=211228 RepID=A0AAJ7C8D5_CEPCN|nr:protocadherin-like wing polarity protein stan isoform X2 [Cephus cinctus]